ncbi:histidinol dehydrogenase, partial [Sulfitobacter sp.]|uniref:histidinol dehydrogenase n=1 Tax=Sulfitobacter sp. TaxID=1903071 RepID=UPI003F6BB592
MAITYLKHGMPKSDRVADDIQVRTIVEETLKDIEVRGDAAVRELSNKYDNYDPRDFRLSASEIEAAIQQVSTREMADIT